MKNQIPWKTFIFQTPQAYHWKLLDEMRPNPVHPKYSLSTAKVKKFRFYKNKKENWVPTTKMRLHLEIPKMPLLFNSEFCEARDLIFNNFLIYHF
jgi:hypothetical protein